MYFVGPYSTHGVQYQCFFEGGNAFEFLEEHLHLEGEGGTGDAEEQAYRGMLDIATGEEDIFNLLVEEVQAENNHDGSMPIGLCRTLFPWKIHDYYASVSRQLFLSNSIQWYVSRWVTRATDVTGCY